MPSKKKKYNARFPAGRIKKIMQTDEEVGKVAQAVPVIISRTLELFVESLLMKALEVTLAKNAKTLSPSHLKQCILAESRFDFLKDLVKNIPDVSQSDERENPSTNCNADNNYPNVSHSTESANSRVALPHPSTSSMQRQRSQSNKRDNGQSSDSGSDYEPPAKRNQRLSFGNGKTQHPSLPLPIAVPPPPVPEVSASSLPTPTTTNNRLPNFYTETLKETQEEDEAPGSVIRPNPEYAPSSSSGFGFYRQNNVNQSPKKQLPPKLHIDVTSPVFKIDLSAMPLSAEATPLAFTPTLVNSPHTPILQSPFSRQNSVGNSGGRKKSCSNEPPPLLPITPVKVSSASSVTKIPNSSMQLDEDYDT